MSEAFEWARKHVVAVICAAIVLLLIVTPRNASALIAVLVSMSVPALVFLLRPTRTIRVSRSMRLAELAVAGPAVAALAVAPFATSVPVALWGIRGQHTGAWLWVALAAVFAAFAERSRQGDLLRAARAIALTGSFLAVTALFTANALVAKYPWLLSFGLAESAPGIVENSISLAQVLLVALGAGGLWLLSARARNERIVAAAALVLMASGLWVTKTLTAPLAIFGALALLVIVRFVRLRWAGFNVRVLPAMLVTAALGLLLLTWTAGSMDPTDPDAAAWNERLSHRPGIWAQAVAKAPDSLLLGNGADHFSAWTQWDSVPGSSMEQVSTDDPHSMLLYWLLAAGIPGLLLALIALWGLTWCVVRALEKARWRWRFVALAAGLLAWLLVTLTAWTGPLAALFATILAGSTVGAVEVSGLDEAGSGETTGPRSSALGGILATPYLAGAVALLLGSTIIIMGAKTVSAELVWAESLRARMGLGAEQLLALGIDSRDPSYVIDAATTYHRLIVQSRDSGLSGLALETVVPVLDRDSTWSVYAALQSVTLTADAALLGAGATADDVERVVGTAKAAAPTSGLWDYAAAVHMMALGDSRAASRHAKAALAFSLPPQVKTWCEGVVKGVGRQ